jgi:hypothetical protein
MDLFGQVLDEALDRTSHCLAVFHYKYVHLMSIYRAAPIGATGYFAYLKPDIPLVACRQSQEDS